ncbi:MAG: hypothetical protein AAGM22_20570, partial [Acidobacteriota bacterium]
MIASSSFRFALLLLAALAASAPLAPPASAAPQVDWDQAVDIHLSSADLVETLKSLATIGGGAIEVDPEVRGSVTADFEATPWSEALDSICRAHDLACYWVAGAPPALRVGPSDVGFSGLAESISLALMGARLDRVLDAFAAISGEPLDQAPDLTAPVDIKLTNVPWPLALDHICQISGCAVDWGATPPRITPAPSRRVEEPALEAFSATEDVFERLAGSRALGPMAPLELVVDDRLPAVLRQRVEGGSWASTLDGACEELGCTWQLVFGEPSLLRLRVRDERVEKKLEIPKGEVDAAQLARTLAQSAGVELDFAPGWTADGTVQNRRTRQTWQNLADTLCLGLHCSWRLDEKTLRLAPARRPIAALPIRRSAPVEVGLHLENTRDTEQRSSRIRVMTDARFTWASPVARVAAGLDQWLHLAWIPFEKPVILPLVADCGERSVEWLDPVALPLDRALDRGTGGLHIELLPKPPRAPKAPRLPAAPAA